MESKKELKEIDIKNRRCYYFGNNNTFWDRILILVIFY